MIKLMFLDYRDLETVTAFTRQAHRPVKHAGDPLLRSDLPSEVNLMSMFGTVIRRPTDGLYQYWYKCYNPNDKGPALGYAQSADGVTWERPGMGVVSYQGKDTNLVFDGGPHGTALIYDERESRPAWRYKMVHGSNPTKRISAHRSPDGVHWEAAGENPIICSTSGGPLGLMRADDGRYVMYIRPCKMDRRVARTESWDFIHWTEPVVVIDQDPVDPVQVQFYGMDAWPYGAYEMGLLWIYDTDANDLAFHKPRGRMFPELTYARSGHAWHRASVGTRWIDLGAPGTWDHAQIHPSSLPVFLEEEVRWYYTACSVAHEFVARGGEPTWAFGYASSRPDRYISLDAGEAEAELLTRPFWSEVGEFWANAQIEPGGYVKVEVADTAAAALEGFSFADAQSLQGDSLRHQLAWSKGKGASLANRQIRLRVRARKAKLFSLAGGTESQTKAYWRFRIPHFLPMEEEKALLGM